MTNGEKCGLVNSAHGGVYIIYAHDIASSNLTRRELFDGIQQAIASEHEEESNQATART